MTPHPHLGPALIALLAWASVLFALRDGPGVTLDEPFNVGEALPLAEHLLAGDLPGLARQTTNLPDHPPLGRIWLGLAAEAARTAQGFAGSALSDLAAARTGSALAHALTVFLIGATAGRWYGRTAGTFAALAVALLPRQFGHAQIASLESSVNLSYAVVVCWAARWMNGPPSIRSAAAGGLFLGLALLTKIQAVFLPVAVGLWLLGRYRQKAVGPLAVWGLVGIAVFFALWPWLWQDPVGHVLQYLGRSAQRPTILVWYFGEVFQDRDVPWHFPWVTFAVTVPLGFHVLGLAGIAVRTPPSTDAARLVAAPALALLAIAVPLVIFSLPGVPVYDGERLFSMVFPLWGIFIGRGAALVFDVFTGRVLRWVSRLIVGAAYALGLAGIVSLAPCQLSYYSPAVGGVSGAESLGLSTTYWGDSLTTGFLDTVAEKLPKGATLQVCPVMTERVQLATLLASSEKLQERQIRLVPWHTHTSPHVLLFSRKEYLDVEFRNPDPDEVEVAFRRGGVLLAALLRVR